MSWVQEGLTLSGVGKTVGKLEQPHYHCHRRRLKDRFLKGGGRGLQDYEILELLLSYAIPRRDVKPLAKELLRRFGDRKSVV